MIAGALLAALPHGGPRDTFPRSSDYPLIKIIDVSGRGGFAVCWGGSFFLYCDGEINRLDGRAGLLFVAPDDVEVVATYFLALIVVFQYTRVHSFALLLRYLY